MAQAEDTQKTAEELEREDEEPDRSDAGAEVGHVASVLEREAEPLQEGRTVDFPFGPLPVRSLAGMAVMVLVSVLVYLAAWALFGTLGLLLGWAPAAALGLLAAREVGRRAEV